MFNVTFRHVRATIRIVEKQQLLYIMSVFVALVIQHAKRLRRVKSSSVMCPALQYSSHYLLNDMFFKKNILNIKMCQSILYTNLCTMYIYYQ
jgi:hypothetical protein